MIEVNNLGIVLVVRGDVYDVSESVESVIKNTKGNYKLFILDNNSDLDSVKYMRDLSSKDKRVGVWRVDKELNRMKAYSLIYPKLARCQYICLLDSVVINESGWNTKLSKEFKSNKNLAITGPIQNKGTLDSFMLDIERGPSDSLVYLNSSCIMLNRYNLSKIIPTFDTKYLVDSNCADFDLSQRVKNIGFDISEVDISISNKAQIEDVNEQDRNLVFQRWGNFVDKKLPVKILVKRQNAIGDTLCVEPILRALKYKFPYSELFLETDRDVLSSSDIIKKSGKNLSSIYNNIDINIDLNDAYERNPTMHIVDAYAMVAGVKLDKELGEHIPVFNRRIKWENPSEKTIVVNSEGSWKNRTWNLDKWKGVLTKLKNDGYKIIEVGKSKESYQGIGEDMIGKYSLLETAKIISEASVYMGFDGGLMHIAQSVGTPIFIIFGCTCPELRIHDWSNAKVLWLNIEQLECAGCHHRLPAPRHQTDCRKQNIYCLDMITEEMVLEKFYSKKFDKVDKFRLTDKRVIISSDHFFEKIYSHKTHDSVLRMDFPVTQVINLEKDRDININGIKLLVGTYHTVSSYIIQVEVLDEKDNSLMNDFFIVNSIQDNTYIDLLFKNKLEFNSKQFKLRVAKKNEPGFLSNLALFIDKKSGGKYIYRNREMKGNIELEIY